MPAPKNPFKAQLAAGQRTIGLWMGMCDPYLAEGIARTGFDWVLIDAEHAPNDIRQIAAQLAVIEPYCAPVVRLPVNESWMIKQALDAGVQSFLAPMISTPDQAQAVVRATRYPPQGIRGVGYPLGRASYFNELEDYPKTANAEICVIVQIETVEGYQNIEEILAVEGVDAAFVGPNDLAADMGRLDELEHPDVVAAGGVSQRLCLRRIYH